jgi:FkbM family methyltransferase
MFKNKSDIQYVVGDFILTLPYSHTLPGYQSHYKKYDTPIKNIVIGMKKYGKLDSILDIGANVGDSAAYIRTFVDSKIYCVEGDDFFLKYLNKNVKLFVDVFVINSFVKGKSSNYSYEISRLGGTAKIQKINNDGGETLIFISLEEIFQRVKNEGGRVSFIKIDTDGFDFDIICENQNLLEKYKPTLFFEYDINMSDDGFTDSIKAIEILSKLGYSFVVYDNYGNLLDTISSEESHRFYRLNQYLKSTRIYGGGLWYCDVLATIDQDVFNFVVESENVLLDL